MPYIDVKLSKKITYEQETAVKADLGTAISAFPGKTEQWLMIGFSDNVHLWFQGNDDAPSAMVEVSVLGALNGDSCEKMTKLICESFEKHLSVSPSRVYVRYQAVSDWGWNNINF